MINRRGMRESLRISNSLSYGAVGAQIFLGFLLLKCVYQVGTEGYSFSLPLLDETAVNAATTPQLRNMIATNIIHLTVL
jgi:hypothetical protein